MIDTLYLEFKNIKAQSRKESMADEAKTESKDLSQKVQSILDSIKELSLMEVNELVGGLEKEFGVSAAAPMMMAGAPAAAGEAAAAEEQTKFDVILKDAGSNKIGAIKAVRTLKPELGLGDAKKFVEDAPQTVLEGASKEDTQKAKAVLEEAGCVVEIK